MLRRMPRSDQHSPVVAADGEHIAVLNSLEARRHDLLRHRVAAIHHLAQLIGERFCHASAGIKFRRLPALLTPCGASKRERLIELLEGHVQRASKQVCNHGCLSNMVRMEVGADDALDGLAQQVFFEYAVPQALGASIVPASVHDKPAIIVFKEIEVDVVKTAVKGHFEPLDSGRNLAQRALLGMFGPLVAEGA